MNFSRSLVVTVSVLFIICVSDKNPDVHMRVIAVSCKVCSLPSELRSHGPIFLNMNGFSFYKPVMVYVYIA